MELFRALGVLAEPPSPAARRLAEVLGLPGRPTAWEYTAVFRLDLHPYASVYVGDEGMLGGEARDRVAGFWRALGLAPPAEPDHLAALLGLYAEVVEREVPGGARTALHLLAWLPVFLDKAQELAAPFYRDWAGLLSSALVAEAERHPCAGGLPLHLRATAPLADPRDSGLEPFLGSLLAPARSGLVLVRADLGRAARELGLGLRLGERRFALRALLAQDAARTLGWLAVEAGRARARHRGLAAPLAPVAVFWAGRAERTAELLGELAATAERELLVA